MPNPLAPWGVSIRSTPLDTAFNSLIIAAVILMFGGPLALVAAKVAQSLSLGAPITLLMAACALSVWIWLSAFMTARVLSLCIFRVRLDERSITYWDGYGRHRLDAADINEVCFLDSLIGHRYIVIRTGSTVHSLANNLWSIADFSRLRDRIEAWRASGDFRFPLTHDDTYSHRTAGEFWSGSKNLPRVYRRYIRPSAIAWAAVTLITVIVARMA